MNFKCTLKLFLALLFYITSAHAFAQHDTLVKQKNKKYSISWTLSYEQGNMRGKKGAESADNLAKSTTYNGMEVQMGFNNNDHKDVYNQIYNQPVTGFGWYASTFHQDIIGNPNALYYFLNLPLYSEKNNRFTLSFMAALGIAYNFNHYDSLTNPTNVYIGSELNSYINFGVLVNYRISPRWVTDISLGFKHFSNGSIKLPNLGINIVPLSIGITYKPKGYVPYMEGREIPKLIKNNQVNFALITAVKNYEIGEPSYLKAAISVNWLRMFYYQLRAGVGLDVFYSAQPESKNQTTSTISNSMSYAVVASGEWVLNKHLYFPFGLGFYLKHNEANDERSSYYERIGIRYRMYNHLFAGVTIKAHKDIADIFEWTVGYTLHHDPNKY